jgi:hypothetical protein
MRAALVAALVAVPLTLAACNKEDPGPPPVIGSYVTGVQVIGQAGATSEVKNEQLPAGTGDGPAVE